MSRSQLKWVVGIPLVLVFALVALFAPAQRAYAATSQTSPGGEATISVACVGGTGLVYSLTNNSAQAFSAPALNIGEDQFSLGSVVNAGATRSTTDPITAPAGTLTGTVQYGYNGFVSWAFQLSNPCSAPPSSAPPSSVPPSSAPPSSAPPSSAPAFVPYEVTVEWLVYEGGSPNNPWPNGKAQLLIKTPPASQCYVQYIQKDVYKIENKQDEDIYLALIASGKLLPGGDDAIIKSWSFVTIPAKDCSSAPPSSVPPSSAPPSSAPPSSAPPSSAPSSGAIVPSASTATTSAAGLVPDTGAGDDMLPSLVMIISAVGLGGAALLALRRNPAKR